MKLSKISLVLALTLILLSGCGEAPTSSPTQPPTLTPNIEINITSTEIIELMTEKTSQPNCQGTAEVENQISKSRAIQHTVETLNGVSVNANGQIGFAGTDIELGATVASELGYSYGTTETLTRSLTVKAGPGANMQHTIRQMEVWKLGTAKIFVGGQETLIPFRFRHDFAIELLFSEDLGGCNKLVPSPVPTTTTVTAIQSCIDVNGVELLSSPWHLEGNNGDAQMYQEVDPDILRGKNMLLITYNLHGLTARPGDRMDESALIIDQPFQWHVVSFANYGQNGLDGEQTVQIPLSDFISLPDEPSGLVGGNPLNLNEPVGTLHTRFWSGGPFTIDIGSICAYHSVP